MWRKSCGLSLASLCLLLVAVYGDDVETDKDTPTRITKPEPNPYYMEVSEGSIEIECRTELDTSSEQLFWYKDGELVIEDEENGVTMVHSVDEEERVSILKMDAITFEDSATYDCRKKEHDTEPGGKIRIYVFQIVTQEDTVAVVDEDLELQCYVEGDIHEGYKPFQWYKGHDLIKSDGEKYIIKDFNDTLIIKDIDREDILEYTCGFDLENGQSFNGTVAVECEPHVKSLGTSKNLVQGDPLVLDCDAWGIPEPDIIWLKDDEPIPEDDDRVTYSDNKGLTNASIRIEDMDFDDYADYTCLAENEHGNGTSTILVRVKDKLAALWPFLGICCEVAILCIIIFIYERRRAKKLAAEEAKEQAAEAEALTNSHDTKKDVRYRKN